MNKDALGLPLEINTRVLPIANSRAFDKFNLTKHHWITTRNKYKSSADS